MMGTKQVSSSYFFLQALYRIKPFDGSLFVWNTSFFWSLGRSTFPGELLERQNLSNQNVTEFCCPLFWYCIHLEPIDGTIQKCLVPCELECSHTCIMVNAPQKGHSPVDVAVWNFLTGGTGTIVRGLQNCSDNCSLYKKLQSLWKLVVLVNSWQVEEDETFQCRQFFRNS